MHNHKKPVNMLVVFLLKYLYDVITIAEYALGTMKTHSDMQSTCKLSTNIQLLQ